MATLKKYRYKLTIEYNGTFYNGFQIQYEENVKTVEKSLIEALYQLSRQQVEINVAGRTDAGVHALGQVIHCDLAQNFSPHQMVMGLNFYLKNEEIAILNAQIVAENFHARFDAKMRHYRYIILNRKAIPIIDKNRVWHIGQKLNLDAIKEASQYLLGEHDFSAFRDSECQAKSPIRTIENINIFNHDDKIFIDISAKSFLHHMVRNIVGTLMWVGKNKIKAVDIKTLLASKNRNLSGPNAPACGLYFLKVDY